MLRLFLLAGGIYLAFFLFWRFFYFFRNPRRDIPKGDAIVAPADGKVIYIQKVLKGQVPLAIKKSAIRLDEIIGLEEFKDHDGYLFGIFLSPFSVHRNRSPIAGRVIKKHYLRAPRNITMLKIGFTSFFNLKPYEQDSEYIVRNERNTIVIQGTRCTVAVTQIADAWINRIICRIAEGEYLAKGEEFGLIRMGSQVDLFLPEQDAVKIQVEVGDTVYAGETVLVSFDT
ncbi:MAG: phosphatidylserine decarboxylase [bacterium]